MGRTKEKKPKGSNGNSGAGSGSYGSDRIAFDARTVRNLSEDLNRISQFTDISWEFTADGKELVVNGIEKEPITFSGYKGAKCFLDGYLLGYDHGYGDGTNDANDVAEDKHLDEDDSDGE